MNRPYWRRVTVRLSVVAAIVAICICMAFLTNAKKVFWVGDKDLAIEFRVIDADTKIPVRAAVMRVFAETKPLNDEREFQLMFDSEGCIRQFFPNCMSSGCRSFWEDSWSVQLPSWYYWVYAPGYQLTEMNDLGSVENHQRMQKEGPVANLTVTISLKKKPSSISKQ